MRPPVMIISGPTADVPQAPAASPRNKNKKRFRIVLAAGVTLDLPAFYSLTARPSRRLARADVPH
jgi:hypothetical protein